MTAKAIMQFADDQDDTLTEMFGLLDEWAEMLKPEELEAIAPLRCREL